MVGVPVRVAKSKWCTVTVIVIPRTKWSRRVAFGYIALFQGTPLLMQLFLMFFGLPMLGLRIEPWTASVLGLTLAQLRPHARKAGAEALSRKHVVLIGIDGESAERWRTVTASTTVPVLPLIPD